MAEDYDREEACNAGQSVARGIQQAMRDGSNLVGGEEWFLRDLAATRDEATSLENLDWPARLAQDFINGYLSRWD